MNDMTLKKNRPVTIQTLARQWNESLFQMELSNMMLERNEAAVIGLRGITGRETVVDNFFWEMSVARFENDQAPDATVKIYEEGFGKNDPRNPNPAAGSRGSTHYIIKCGERRIGNTYGTLPVAKMKAKIVHEEMVEAVMKLRQEQELEELTRNAGNPLFGTF